MNTLHCYYKTLPSYNKVIESVVFKIKYCALIVDKNIVTPEDLTNLQLEKVLETTHFFSRMQQIGFSVFAASIALGFSFSAYLAYKNTQAKSLHKKILEEDLVSLDGLTNDNVQNRLEKESLLQNKVKNESLLDNNKDEKKSFFSSLFNFFVTKKSSEQIPLLKVLSSEENSYLDDDKGKEDKYPNFLNDDEEEDSQFTSKYG